MTPEQSNNQMNEQTYGLNYQCCFCHESIPDQEIPDECKRKISVQLVWHERCIPE